MKNVLVLLACLAVCFAAAAIGSAFTIKSIPTWYAALAKPPLNPPNWIFGPVWSLLYTAMAVAVFLVIKNGFKGDGVTYAAVLFGAQLVLNALWSVVFFGKQNPLIALIIIIVLWVAILLTIIAFYRVSKPAAYIMIPYILWVSFASYLNAGVWWINKG
jgi:translocator protein